MSSTRIELHIDELALHGFPPGDRYRIAEGLEHELARLIAAHGVPALLGHATRVTMLDGGSFSLQANAGAARIGGQVAQAIYEGMRR
jgi:hypothetical protein